MAKRPAKPAPVFKVELEDNGQDFTTWYVRSRTVIDSAPLQARFWVGTRIARMPQPGDKMRYMTRYGGGYRELMHAVVSVEQVSDEAAAEIVQQYRDLMREIINE